MQRAPDLSALCADELKIKQILINLLSNSVKFTPSGGFVAVSAVLTANGAMQSAVQDTGIGIATEDIPKALSPFGQMDSDLKRKYQGTGSALPWCRPWRLCTAPLSALQARLRAAPP